jgi:hypothetical protein
VTPTPLKRPLGSLLRGCAAVRARITEVIERIEPPPALGEDGAWFYGLAETDPETATFLDLEGLRRRPRRRSDRERWTA